MVMKIEPKTGTSFLRLQSKIWKDVVNKVSGKICGDLLILSLTDDISPQADQHVVPESSTLALLDLLPSVACLSPQQALQLMETTTKSKINVTHT